MKKISGLNRELDLLAFADSSVSTGTVKYGLPSEVQFCSKCVISNQRPNSAVEFRNDGSGKKNTIGFDGGICEACRINELKQQIDWDARIRELEVLCDKHRKNNGDYDCIVPGSGGKDSFFAARFLKEEMRMHPLTVTWAPHIYTDWGRDNFDSWVGSGIDNYCVTPNVRIHRLLTRLALEKLLHPFQPFMLGQKGLAPKIARMFDIPLIFYGENEAEYGNPIGDFGKATRSAEFFSSSNVADQTKIFLGGYSIEEIIGRFDLERSDFAPYLPMSIKQAKACQVHYLGYYVPWHPQSMYYYTMAHSSFKPAPERSAGTYSRYSSLDDKIDDLHYYTTGAKFGLGRASYDAAQEVRNGDLTRDEAVAVVTRYDHEFPSRFMKESLEYMSITDDLFAGASSNFEAPEMSADYFMVLVDSFRSPHLWKYANGNFALRKTLND